MYGDFFKSLRLGARLNMKQLCEAAEIAYSTYCLIESNSIKPSNSIHNALVTYYNLTEEDRERSTKLYYEVRLMERNEVSPAHKLYEHYMEVSQQRRDRFDKIYKRREIAAITKTFQSYCIFLKTIRKRTRLSQKDFAQKIGIATTDQSKVESGHRQPSYTLHKAILKYIKLSNEEKKRLNASYKEVRDLHKNIDSSEDRLFISYLKLNPTQKKKFDKLYKMGESSEIQPDNSNVYAIDFENIVSNIKVSIHGEVRLIYSKKQMYLIARGEYTLEGTARLIVTLPSLSPTVSEDELFSLLAKLDQL